MHFNSELQSLLGSHSVSGSHAYTLSSISSASSTCKVGCVLDLILSGNWCILKTKINQTRVVYYSVHVETEAISMQTTEKDVIYLLLF